MKAILFLGIMMISPAMQGPSLVGKWQLLKQTHCIENEMDDDDDDGLLADMKSRSGRTPQILQFKENNQAEENTRIINRRKTYNSKNMLYRFDGKTLYMLDKKSRIIIEGFSVEKFSGDSLILSNTARACETRVFVKIL